MTIDEAIEILRLLVHNAGIQNQTVDIPALQLGIEALKARKRDKELGYINLSDLLPGETDE